MRSPQLKNYRYKVVNFMDEKREIYHEKKKMRNSPPKRNLKNH